MPGFDGTGPKGKGPMTGRGEGYCAIEIPEPGRTSRGYAGIQGTPIRLTQSAYRCLLSRFPSWRPWNQRKNPSVQSAATEHERLNQGQ